MNRFAKLDYAEVNTIYSHVLYQREGWKKRKGWKIGVESKGEIGVHV